MTTSDPAQNTILNFTPDNRFAMVHFDGYRDQELVVSLALPFIGWAVVVSWVKDGEYGTRLAAVGLDQHGQPVTAESIEQNYDLAEGQAIQTRLDPAEGAAVADFQPWPDYPPLNNSQ